MDWWAGMNSCGADINHIEAGIFDPWTNCDDLGSATITLHQSSNNNINNNSSSNSSSTNNNSTNNNSKTIISINDSTTSANSSSSSPPTSSSSSSSSTGVVTQKVRRCRHITDYVLADEEKRLLIKEGYADFPMTCQARPLSKSEERILRKIRRKIRNKKSAQCSRQRKKEYVEDLERKYTAVIRENEELKQVLEKIQQQQQQLIQEQQQHLNYQQQQHHHHHHQQHQQHGQFHQQGSIDWKEFYGTSTEQPAIVDNVYN